MRWLLPIVFLLCGATVASGAGLIPEKKDFINGDPPGPEVVSWIRLNMMGNRDQPPPIVWISPQVFKKRWPERLIVVTRAEYEDLVRFARRNRCPDTVDRWPAWRTLKLTEYRDSRAEILCMMQPRAACAFLAGLQNLPNVPLSVEEKSELRILARTFRCRSF